MKMFEKVLVFSIFVLIGYCWFAPPCQAQGGPVSRAGYCPYLPPGTVGSCAQLCSNDSDCFATQKCCSNGCGRQCSPIQNVPLACNVHCPAGQHCQFQIPPWCHPAGSCMLWPTCMPGSATSCTGVTCRAGQICQVVSGTASCVAACQCPCPASRSEEALVNKQKSFFYGFPENL